MGTFITINTIHNTLRLCNEILKRGTTRSIASAMIIGIKENLPRSLKFVRNSTLSQSGMGESNDSIR